jgi:hypothetical protein
MEERFQYLFLADKSGPTLLELCDGTKVQVWHLIFTLQSLTAIGSLPLSSLEWLCPELHPILTTYRCAAFGHLLPGSSAWSCLSMHMSGVATSAGKVCARV